MTFQSALRLTVWSVHQSEPHVFIIIIEFAVNAIAKAWLRPFPRRSGRFARVCQCTAFPNLAIVSEPLGPDIVVPSSGPSFFSWSVVSPFMGIGVFECHTDPHLHLSYSAINSYCKVWLCVTLVSAQLI
jgi:hypothetical protein